jgi:hypothetical protein
MFKRRCAWLLVSGAWACAGAWAQVSIQPSDAGAQAFVARGSEVSHLQAKDQSRHRVLLALDGNLKTATFTQSTQSAAGELERLTVSGLSAGSLRAAGEYGSRVETQDNDLFDEKVHVVVLICEGANAKCVHEQSHNSVNGEVSVVNQRTFFKAHFNSLADAQRVLAQIMALRR